jgi:hypothetical protein
MVSLTKYEKKNNFILREARMSQTYGKEEEKIALYIRIWLL